jgi:hypothetical protein
MPSQTSPVPLTTDELLAVVLPNFRGLLFQSSLRFYKDGLRAAPPGPWLDAWDELGRRRASGRSEAERLLCDEITALRCTDAHTLFPALRELAAALVTERGEPVTAGVTYAGPGVGAIVGARRCDHDVIVRQCEGRTQWIVQGPGGDGERRSFALAPGDSLEVPRGAVHSARNDGPEASLTVSFAVQRTDDGTVFEWLRDVLEDEAEFQQPLAAGPGEVPSADRLRALAQIILAKLESPGAAAEFGEATDLKRQLPPLRPGIAGIERPVPRRALGVDGIARPDLRWATIEPLFRRSFVPVRLLGPEGQRVRLLDLGDRRLVEPFFQQTVRAVEQEGDREHRELVTSVALLEEVVAINGPRAVRPGGFIFHVSRTGSTLVSRLLASSARALVVSEPEVVNQALSLADLGDARRERLLTTLIRALGLQRWSACEHHFLKLSSWNVTRFALFRRAFPDVPFVVLYRKPADVLASLRARPSQWLARQAAEGRAEQDPQTPDLLTDLYRAAFESAQHGGLLIEYDELPSAIWTRILPHFGVRVDPAWRASMEALARFDAKDLHLTRPFVPQPRARVAAPEEDLQGCQRWYDRLREARRRAAG